MSIDKRISFLFFILIFSLCMRFQYDATKAENELNLALGIFKKGSQLLGSNTGFKNALTKEARSVVDRSIRDAIGNLESSVLEGLFVVDSFSGEVVGSSAVVGSKFTYSIANAFFPSVKPIYKAFIDGDFLFLTEIVTDLDFYIISVINLEGLKKSFGISTVTFENGKIIVASFDVKGILHKNIFIYILIALLGGSLILAVILSDLKVKKAVSKKTEKEVEQRLEESHAGLRHDFFGINKSVKDMLKTALKPRVLNDSNRLANILHSAIIHLTWSNRLSSQIGLIIKEKDLRLLDFNLYDMLVDFRDSSMVMHRTKTLDIIIDDKDTRIFGDMDMLYLALINLMQNAARHGDFRRKLVRLEVLVSGDSLTLKMINGGSIESDLKPRVFLRGAKREGSPGEGLGLYRTRKILRLMGGDLWLTSCSLTKEVIATIDLPKIYKKRNVS